MLVDENESPIKGKTSNDKSGFTFEGNLSPNIGTLRSCGEIVHEEAEFNQCIDLRSEIQTREAEGRSTNVALA